MTCKKCGAALAEDASFCAKCGERVERIPVTQDTADVQNPSSKGAEEEVVEKKYIFSKGTMMGRVTIRRTYTEVSVVDTGLIIQKATKKMFRRAKEEERRIPFEHIMFAQVHTTLDYWDTLLGVCFALICLIYNLVASVGLMYNLATLFLVALLLWRGYGKKIVLTLRNGEKYPIPYHKSEKNESTPLVNLCIANISTSPTFEPSTPMPAFKTTLSKKVATILKIAAAVVFTVVFATLVVLGNTLENSNKTLPDMEEETISSEIQRENESVESQEPVSSEETANSEKVTSSEEANKEEITGDSEKYATVKEFLDDPDVRAELNQMIESMMAEDDTMRVSINGGDNVMIYTFTYTEEALEGVYIPDLCVALEEGLDSEANTYGDIAESLSSVVDAEDVKVIVVFTKADGSILVSKEFEPRTNYELDHTNNSTKYKEVRGQIHGCEIAIQSARTELVEYQKGYVAVTFEFTNLTNDTTACIYIADIKAYQGGIELEEVYSSTDLLNADYFSKNIKPNTTIQFEKAFYLTGSEDIEIEVNSLFSSLDGTPTISRTFDAFTLE